MTTPSTSSATSSLDSTVANNKHSDHHNNTQTVTTTITITDVATSTTTTTTTTRTITLPDGDDDDDHDTCSDQDDVPPSSPPLIPQISIIADAANVSPSHISSASSKSNDNNNNNSSSPTSSKAPGSITDTLKPSTNGSTNKSHHYSKPKPFYDLTPDFDNMMGAPHSSHHHNNNNHNTHTVSSPSKQRRRSLFDDDFWNFSSTSSSDDDSNQDFMKDLILDESTMCTSGSQKFLNEYDPRSLIQDLKTKVLGTELAAMGFRDIVMQLDVDDVFVHRVVVSDLSLIQEADLPKPKKDLVPKSIDYVTKRVPADNAGVDNDGAGERVETVEVRYFLLIKPGERFMVRTSNFLLDLFCRRREVGVWQVKGFQQLFQVLKEKNPETYDYQDPTHHAVPVTVTTGSEAGSSASNKSPYDQQSQQLRQPLPSPPVSPVSQEVDPDTSPTQQSNIPTLLSTSATLTHSETPTNSFQTHLASLLQPKDLEQLHTFLTSHFPPLPTHPAQTPHKAAITVFEWTCMQNPLTCFVPHRAPFPFPGQTHPGLHVAKKFLSHLSALATQRHRDALVSVPEHVHNAWLYHYGGWRFVNPAFEGYFRAIVGSPKFTKSTTKNNNNNSSNINNNHNKSEGGAKGDQGGDLYMDIQKHGLAAISWAFYHGHVKDRVTGEIEIWKPEEQYFPTSRRFRTFFYGASQTPRGPSTHAVKEDKVMTTMGMDVNEYEEVVKVYEEKFRGRLYIDWESSQEIWKYSMVYKDRVIEV
jgi:hypothetical protein